VIGASGLGTGTALSQANAPILLGSSEANGSMSLVWYENPTGPGNIVQIGLNGSSPGSMTVTTGDLSDTTYVWDFDNTGNLILPTGSKLGYAGLGYTGLTGANNSPIEITTNTSNGNTSAQLFLNTNGNLSILTGDEANATSYTWSFGNTGNLTLPSNTFSINYANGTQVSLSGSYGNSNVATFLASYGSNTISTTGNVTAGNFIGKLANGNSNVSVATSNGNVTINAVGNNTMTITGTGANVTGTVTSTGKIGYASGSTVTQITSRSTAVTINALSGEITLFGSSMTAGQVDYFTMTNNQIEVGDIIVCATYGGSLGTYLPMSYVTSATQAAFTFRNLDSFVTAAETPIIKFIIIKAPTA
jgi:hypothetical protein